MMGVTENKQLLGKTQNGKRTSLPRKCAAAGAKENNGKKNKKPKTNKHNTTTTIVVQQIPVRKQTRSNDRQTYEGLANTMLGPMEAVQQQYDSNMVQLPIFDETETLPEAAVSGHQYGTNHSQTLVPNMTGQWSRPGLQQTTVTMGKLNDLAQSSTRSLLKIQTKDYLFQINKFVDDNDLNFSNASNSICRQLAGLLNIPDTEIEQWWLAQRKGVLTSFHSHRNNVIKSI